MRVSRHLRARRLREQSAFASGTARNLSHKPAATMSMTIMVSAFETDVSCDTHQHPHDIIPFFVGFHRRPNVRGVSVKQQLGASNEILQQMQNELQPSPTASATPTQPHACQRTTSNYSWPYYSEANLNSRPQSRASASSTWYVCRSS